MDEGIRILIDKSSVAHHDGLRHNGIYNFMEVSSMMGCLISCINKYNFRSTMYMWCSVATIGAVEAIESYIPGDIVQDVDEATF